MKTISGLFDTHEEASKAVDALEDAGIASNDISVVGPDGKTDASAQQRGPASARQSAGSVACWQALALLQSQALAR